ncbi:hypothetical protein HMPREF1316_0549 [Olsenella profusa F0195]|uniref:Uncharacterized protein n=1 Tax=Olsenella profusa F0195 TaxID=1125712 RepID=U2TKV9_9ACTN|nr:hypothetical protein HMPREF1316_0549 [Olsenella profusa F0195]
MDSRSVRWRRDGKNLSVNALEHGSTGQEQHPKVTANP